MKKEIWTTSVREEIVCILWLIAAILAYQNHIIWLTWFCGIWSSLAFICSIIYKLLEKKADRILKQIKPELRN